MKTLSRHFLGFLIIFSLFISIAPTAFAEGTTMIDLSNKSPAVGDKITMTVTGTDSSTITVKYNGSVLNFSSCNVSGYTTDGNTVTFTGASGAIEFVASAAGSSNLIVSSDALTGSSTTLSVAGDSSSSDSGDSSEGNESTQTDNTTQTDSSETDEQTSTDTGSSSDTAENYDFMCGDTAYVISKRFTESQIPAGFESTTVTIHDSEYKAVSNGSLTLLYLKKASDTYGEGEFFIYNADSDSVSELLMIGSKDDYVMVTTPDSLPSDQLTEVPYSGEAGDFSAYQFGGVNNDFYYIYGIDENGTAGWFVFDAAEQTVSRANVDAFALIGSTQTDTTEDVPETVIDDNENGFLSKVNMRNVVAVLILVLAVVVVILINIAVSKSRSDEDDEDDQDDDEDENQKSLKDIVKEADASTPSPKAVTDEDDDYEDDDDEDDEPRGFFFRRRKKEEDIWNDEDGDDDPDDSEEDDKNDDDDNNHSGNSGNGNREINLMDLNNL